MTITWIDFNINHIVRVKLTQRGKDILQQDADQFRRVNPSVSPYTPPKEDADGWSEWQLWSLMQHLGHYCYMGAVPPFETTIQFQQTSSDLLFVPNSSDYDRAMKSIP